MTTALIVVDVQNDFCEGGALGVQGGCRVAAQIADFIGSDLALAKARGYSYVVATRDCHIDPGSHFSDHPDFVDSWPRHCVKGTDGQQLHPALAQIPFDAIFDKGAFEAAYSGFEGVDADGKPLHQWLNEHGVLCVDVVGIATDFCVQATALDAAQLGYFTSVRLNLSAAVNPDNLARVVTNLKNHAVLTLH